MITQVIVYNPKTRQQETHEFDEDWRAASFVHKCRAERKKVIDVQRKHPDGRSVDGTNYDAGPGFGGEIGSEPAPAEDTGSDSSCDSSSSDSNCD